ncbi:MAG: hypothetical protein H7X86_12515 [Gorillibacterium sp.]|nr:hypothetical protein [Gorillibacterium sp.]
MIKKSKVWMIGLSVAAVSLFTVTAFASTPTTGGYDVFKEVLKANHMSEKSVDSATIKGGFTVKVDGETVLTADGTTKVVDAGDQHSVSSDFGITLMGVERTGSLYSSGDDVVYLVDGTHDLHYSVNNLHDKQSGKYHRSVKDDKHQDRQMSKGEEALFDFMVGDLKDDFSVTNQTDGSKTITVDVSKEEIPLPLRLLLDVASAADKDKRAHAPEASEKWEQLKQFPFFQGLEGVNLEAHLLPKLTKDVAIERVRLQMTVNANNELLGMFGELEVSGKDEAGVTHRVELKSEGDFSGINATTPDVFDPAGKTVKTIDGITFGDHR